MSGTDIKDWDLSAAGRENLGLPEGSRAPFHETIVGAILASNAEELRLLKKLIEVTTIPKNHEAIVASLDQRAVTLSKRGWGREQIEAMRRAVLEQKAEAEARATEQAKLATDAEKVTEFNLLVGLAAIHLAVIGRAAPFQLYARRILEAKTLEDLQKARGVLEQ